MIMYFIFWMAVMCDVLCAVVFQYVGHDSCCQPVAGGVRGHRDGGGIDSHPTLPVN